jgi:hypothetical protein
VWHAQPPRTSTSPLPVTRRSPQHTPLQTTDTVRNPHTGHGHHPEDAHVTVRGHPLPVSPTAAREPPAVQATRRSANSELRPGTGKGGRRRAAPGSRPRLRPPRRHNPPRHAPSQQQQGGGKTDALSSANGPCTARCSKDVTTHQHKKRFSRRPVSIWRQESHMGPLNFVPRKRMRSSIFTENHRI